ncbi:MAG: MgtC/SapB family protein [Labilithrix sp.]|nr:MgtC/SapB family protein [Labilithrix sp.]
MPAALDWRDVVVRLALTVIAGALFGLNREAHGGPAGLRTTILVCLAASIAMLQANALLPTTGRPADAWATLDLMRLPLGILSGVGFIGAGVIFRRSDLVLGVTTAAILWITTAIGLCFGGGQLALGVAATAIGLVVLWGFKWLEQYVRQDLRAALVVTTAAAAPASEELRRLLEEEGYHVTGEALRYGEAAREIRYDVRWRGSRREVRTPSFVAALATKSGVRDVTWRPEGFGDL